MVDGIGKVMSGVILVISVENEVTVEVTVDGSVVTEHEEDKPWGALIGIGIAVVDGNGKVMAGVILAISDENEVEDVEDVEVVKPVVEVEDTRALEVAFFDTFAQLPSLLGRQFTHDLPAFTQAQPLHKPVLLHLQHTMSKTHFSSSATVYLLHHKY